MPHLVSPPGSLGSLEFTLKWEGVYSNDPNDPGGETKWGISKKAYPKEDIKNMTRERALEIYAQDYWLKAGCDALPYPLCVAVFDAAVNCGVGRAISWLRHSNGVDSFMALRKQFYLELVKVNPKLQRYARGWWARVADLDKLISVASS